MRFLKATRVTKAISERMICIEYLDKQKKQCTLFVQTGNEPAADTLTEIINNYVAEDKRDIDDGK